MILLLALISSRKAAVDIRSGSHVVGRSGDKGHPAAAGRCVCLSIYMSVGPSVWVTGGGSVTLDRSGGTGNTYVFL